MTSPFLQCFLIRYKVIFLSSYDTNLGHIKKRFSVQWSNVQKNLTIIKKTKHSH